MRKCSKNIFAWKRKKSVFSLVSLRSETMKNRSETKANEAKNAKRNETKPKN
jgi:hypothetical protein